MKAFKTEQRIRRITQAILQRQHSLHVVLENIHDPHNVSAIFRTCDAVGVPKVSLLYTIEKFPKLSRIASGSAKKWVEKEKYKNAKDCFENLRRDGFKIFASNISDNSRNLYDLDLTGKIAIVLGNEHRGVSKETAEFADENFIIPMHGMVQSLNVSVAAAVILYEVLRQRKLKGMYNQSELGEDQLSKLVDEWCTK